MAKGEALINMFGSEAVIQSQVRQCTGNRFQEKGGFQGA
jgi:hypothetical protein